MSDTSPKGALYAALAAAREKCKPAEKGSKNDELFWSRVARGDGDYACWLWLGARVHNGYGHLRRSGVDWYAHRYAFFLERGPEAIPAGLDLCHRCDVRHCVNPGHLFVGTRLDNMRDAKRKGRIRSGDRHGLRLHPERVARGERQHCARLSENDVREIRRLAAEGAVQRALAKRFGVSRGAVRGVLSGQNWRHVS